MTGRQPPIVILFPDAAQRLGPCLFAADTSSVSQERKAIYARRQVDRWIGWQAQPEPSLAAARVHPGDLILSAGTTQTQSACARRPESCAHRLHRHALVRRLPLVRHAEGS